MWPKLRIKHFSSQLELIGSLLEDRKGWWCGHCNEGLFLRPSRVCQHRDFS
jgi:hypothetical protein